MSNLSSVAVAKAYEDAHDAEVRDLARQHTKDAVSTLVRLMKGKRTPAGVKRQCAMDIIAQGWGRPDSRADSGGVSAQARGLTINILKLSTGTVEKIHTNSEVAGDVLDAADVARLIAEQTQESNT